MEEFGRTIKYFGLIISSLWRQNGSKVVKTSLFLLSTILIIDCLVLVGLLGGFPDNITLLVNDFSAELRIGLTRLTFGILFLGLLFPFLFVHEAAKLHGQQDGKIQQRETEIEELKDIINQDLQKAKVRIETYPRESENYASLKIFNDESKDITKAYVKIESLLVNYSANPTREYDELSTINPNNYFVSWAGGDNGDGTSTVKIKDHAVLNVAKILKFDTGNWWLNILLHKGDNDKRYAAGEYKFKVSFRGILGDKPIRPEEFNFAVVLKMTQVGENSRRTEFYMKEIE
jgi:hypothetical protein